MRRPVIIALILILIVAVRYFMMRVPARIPKGDPWTVYGTMGCGWTRKQLDYMRKKGIPHVFVDCDTKECAGMDAFPTLVSPRGARHKGYNEV